jgi:hypothetical protein
MSLSSAQTNEASFDENLQYKNKQRNKQRNKQKQNNKNKTNKQFSFREMQMRLASFALCSCPTVSACATLYRFLLSVIDNLIAPATRAQHRISFRKFVFA